MAGQGSAGNIVAALCSFFIPGLGQLLQGRLAMAVIQFCLASILWFLPTRLGDSSLVRARRCALEAEVRVIPMPKSV